LVFFFFTEKLRAKGVQLYQAALKGDWKAANGIIIEQKDIIYQKITSKSETVLHIAVAAKHEGFVRNLLGSLESNDLALRNVDGNTALCFAAASGVVEIAKMLIEKNKDLPMIRGGEKRLQSTWQPYSVMEKWLNTFTRIHALENSMMKSL